MYEIPEELKNLYRHFDKHVAMAKEQTKDVAKETFDPELLKGIEAFASERMHVWNNRTKNQPRPYTTDEALQKYRFCNIYRELDRQTVEIHKLLNPLRDDFDIWLLNLFFCRFVCKTKTIEKVGLLSYDEEHNKAVYKKLWKLERPKYGSAYIFPISIIQKSGYPTRESFFCLYLPQVMKKVADEVRTFDNISVVSGVKEIVKILEYNFNFHTTEVLIDMQHQLKLQSYEY